jgi:hypothetical protein
MSSFNLDQVLQNLVPPNNANQYEYAPYPPYPPYPQQAAPPIHYYPPGAVVPPPMPDANAAPVAPAAPKKRGAPKKDSTLKKEVPIVTLDGYTEIPVSSVETLPVNANIKYRVNDGTLKNYGLFVKLSVLSTGKTVMRLRRFNEFKDNYFSWGVDLGKVINIYRKDNEEADEVPEPSENYSIPQITNKYDEVIAKLEKDIILLKSQLQALVKVIKKMRNG